MCGKVTVSKYGTRLLKSTFMDYWNLFTNPT